MVHKHERTAIRAEEMTDEVRDALDKAIVDAEDRIAARVALNEAKIKGMKPLEVVMAEIEGWDRN